MENKWHSAKVVHGNQNGRKWGYPTINLAEVKPVLNLSTGVYAARVQAVGRFYMAMLYIGTRPTLSLSEPVVEIHLLDFQGDLYGQEVLFQEVEQIRGEKKFGTVEELIYQLQADEKSIRLLFSLQNLGQN